MTNKRLGKSMTTGPKGSQAVPIIYLPSTVGDQCGANVGAQTFV